jgi:hypothetical protein
VMFAKPRVNNVPAIRTAKLIERSLFSVDSQRSTNRCPRCLLACFLKSEQTYRSFC